MPHGPNQPGGMPPPNLPPGRKIEELERATFDHGRELVIAVVTVSELDPATARYVTRREQRIQGLDCGCTIGSVREASQCAVCGELVCVARHTATCSFCNRNVGVACAEVVPLEGGSAFGCRECVQAMKEGPLTQLAKWLWQAMRSGP